MSSNQNEDFEKFKLVKKETKNGINLFLNLCKPLDRENVSFYNLELIAKDGGKPSK